MCGIRPRSKLDRRFALDDPYFVMSDAASLNRCSDLEVSHGACGELTTVSKAYTPTYSILFYSNNLTTMNLPRLV